MVKLLLQIVFPLVLSLSSCIRLGEHGIKSPLKIKAAGFIESNIAWLVTSKGDFLKTGDAGATWVNIPASRLGGFEQVDFIDLQQGWAVNRNAEVWHTKNGGLDWVRLSILDYTSEPFVGPIHKIKFVDAIHGWIIDPFSVWRTNDGGMRWEKTIPWANSENLKEVVYSCYFISPDMGWLGGDHGVIYSTIDGGEKWLPKRIAPKEMLFDTIEFIDNKTGWASAKPIKIIYRTDDGGKTWHEASPSGIDNRWRLLFINFISNSEGWAVGQDNSDASKNGKGILLHSLDGGKTWQPKQTNLDEPLFLVVGFKSEQDGWLVGHNNVYRTHDGGKTWLTVLKLQ